MSDLLSIPTPPAAAVDDAEQRQALYDAVWADVRKGAPEFEVSAVQIVLGEIAHTIRHLRRWMRTRRVPSSAPSSPC